MIEKCSLGNMNNNMKIIGLILLFCILFIVIIYYFRSTFKKHNDIVESFNTFNATINQTGGTIRPDLDTNTQTHSVNLFHGKEGNNDIINGEISMRKCQVYFVGEKEQSDCDTKYNEDPLTTNCKYEFKDGWNEIDTIKNINNNIITLPKKIYNKQYTNIDNIENSGYMTACFKDRASNGNTKYLYDMKDNVLMYGSGGSVDDATDNNKTLRLNVKDGDKDPMIKSYISKHFGKTGDTKNDNLNMISSICSIGYNNVVPTNIKNFYKFNLIKNGNEWVLKDIKDVKLNDSQTAFSDETDSNFTGSSTYGMYIDSSTVQTNGTIKFTVFKLISIPNKKVQIYRFKYNYLCGDKGKVLEYNLQIDSEIKMNKLISNTGSSISKDTFDVSYNSNIIDSNFWTTSDANVDTTTHFIDMLNIAKKALIIDMMTDGEYSRLTNEIIAIEKSIGGDKGINGTGGANGVRNNFHTSLTLDRGEIGKTSIIGLNHNDNKLFDFDKGYKLTVDEQKPSTNISKDGNEPLVFSSGERMYPPIHNFTNNSHTISGQSYGNGLYVSTSSRSHMHDLSSFNLFSTVNTPSVGNWSAWCSPQDTAYNSSTGFYTIVNTTRTLGDSYHGEWVKIELPLSIIPTKMSIHYFWGYPASRPRDFKIYGSTNNTTWTNIYTQINATYGSNNVLEFNISVTTQFKFFAIVINAVAGSGYVCFRDWFIYGKESIQPIKINDDYKYFSFINSGANKTQYSITFPEKTECDILIVGGGGAGGSDNGGGGGAGGLVFLSNINVVGNYNIEIGKGGTGNDTQNRGGNGTLSKFNNGSIEYIASGGGGGGGGHDWLKDPRSGGDGGSGGGSCGESAPSNIGNTNQVVYNDGIVNRGFGSNGGSCANGGGGGGGGSRDVGQSVKGYLGGHGGNGKSEANGINFKTHFGLNGSEGIGELFNNDIYFAGGGGGGNENGSRPTTLNGVLSNTGGSGGGGKGSSSSSKSMNDGTNGINNTGGGGGGSQWGWGPGRGGDGGSGIVIIRYRLSISDKELITISEKHVTDNKLLTNTSYLINNNSFIFGTVKYPSQEIHANKLIKIIITSIIFLESKKAYNLNINLGIATGNTIYYVSSFKIKGIDVTGTNDTYNFTTIDGGFYKFSFIAVVILKKNTIIRFNITGTDNFNYINYLYGGSTLNDNIDTHNNTFKSVLYINNTQLSIRSIVNVLHSTNDYWGITQMNTKIGGKISERDARKSVIDNEHGNKIKAYDDVIDLINARDFSGNNPITKTPWFNTTNPTLNTNVSPSSIFTGYNDVNYITYEKRKDTTDNTPTIIVGNVGANFTTNFQINNTIDKATIYVLRE